jgi:hypothetical protein
MTTQDPTANYAWDLPNVAGDSGAWGTLLNTIIGDDVTGIDKRLFDATATANGALQKAGGVLTGHLDVKTQHITGATVAGGSGGTKTIDLSAANFYRFTSDITGGAVIFDFTNITGYSADGVADLVAVIIEMRDAGAASSISYRTDGAARTPKWQDGAAPTYTVAGKDVFVFYTYDNGGSWFGVHAIADPS